MDNVHQVRLLLPVSSGAFWKNAVGVDFYYLFLLCQVTSLTSARQHYSRIIVCGSWSSSL